MPATGVKTGLLFFVALAALGAGDQPASALARFASALSQNDAPAALAVFDREMKGYGEIEGSIVALTSQTDVLCAIEVLEEHESGADRLLDTDWYLQLKSQAPGGQTERRRERVSVTLRQVRGQWRIVALSPVESWLRSLFNNSVKLPAASAHIVV